MRDLVVLTTPRVKEVMHRRTLIAVSVCFATIQPHDPNWEAHHIEGPTVVRCFARGAAGRRQVRKVTPNPVATLPDSTSTLRSMRLKRLPLLSADITQSEILCRRHFSK
jgi:hypothetical protein